MLRPRRAIVPVLVVLLAGPTLTACGSQEDRYCQAVEEHQKELTDIASRSGAPALFEARDVYEQLAAEAPDDIRDEWDTVIEAIDGLEATVESLGIDPATYDAQEPPADLSRQQRERLRAAAERLVAPGTAAAMEAVQQQARDVCQAPLSL